MRRIFGFVAVGALFACGAAIDEADETHGAFTGWQEVRVYDCKRLAALPNQASNNNQESNNQASDLFECAVPNLGEYGASTNEDVKNHRHYLTNVIVQMDPFENRVEQLETSTRKRVWTAFYAAFANERYLLGQLPYIAKPAWVPCTEWSYDDLSKRTTKVDAQAALDKRCNEKPFRHGSVLVHGHFKSPETEPFGAGNTTDTNTACTGRTGCAAKVYLSSVLRESRQVVADGRPVWAAKSQYEARLRGEMPNLLRFGIFTKYNKEAKVYDTYLDVLDKPEQFNFAPLVEAGTAAAQAIRYSPLVEYLGLRALADASGDPSNFLERPVGSTGALLAADAGAYRLNYGSEISAGKNVSFTAAEQTTIESKIDRNAKTVNGKPWPKRVPMPPSVKQANGAPMHFDEKKLANLVEDYWTFEAGLGFGKTPPNEDHSEDNWSCERGRIAVRNFCLNRTEKRSALTPEAANAVPETPQRPFDDRYDIFDWDTGTYSPYEAPLNKRNALDDYEQQQRMCKILSHMFFTACTYAELSGYKGCDVGTTVTRATEHVMYWLPQFSQYDPTLNVGWREEDASALASAVYVSQASLLHPPLRELDRIAARHAMRLRAAEKGRYYCSKEHSDANSVDWGKD